jgi:MFS family permease
MKRRLFLLACLFVVMIGFGITLPVLPFYVERLALAEGASRQSVVLHVGMLTGVYALTFRSWSRVCRVRIGDDRLPSWSSQPAHGSY